MIEVRGLRCRFGDVVALDGVDLDVARGEAVALLGHNGAGKSTLLRVLAGRVTPHGGTVRVAGRDVVRERRAAARVTGVVQDAHGSWFGRLSGRRNLEYAAGLVGLRQTAARRAAAEGLEAVALTDVADRPVDGYSAGMRARLGVARACLTAPDALLLDEASAGLDAASMRQLEARLAAMRPTTAILLASHDLGEVARVADRALVLREGRVARACPAPLDAAELGRALA